MHPFVVALYPRVSACEYYRAVMPLHYLQQGPWQTLSCTLQEWMRRSASSAPLRKPTILIAPRIETDKIEALEKLRASTPYIVYETDDNLTNKYRIVSALPIEHFARAADLITVTTPHLAKVMSVYGPTKVLPNFIDPKVTGIHYKNDDPRYSNEVRILLSGTASHYGDWKQVLPALEYILKKFTNAHVTIAGFHPDYLSGIDPLRVSYEPFHSYPGYMKLIYEHDIVLCPIDTEDKFNLSKSAIKAIEGMAVARNVNGHVGGAVPIASNSPVYRRAVTRATGRLVEPDGWTEALVELIENKRERERLSVAGHAWVMKNRNINTGWKLWHKAYTALLRGL